MNFINILNALCLVYLVGYTVYNIRQEKIVAEEAAIKAEKEKWKKREDEVTEARKREAEEKARLEAEKDKVYIYHIVFNHKDKDGMFGTGNITLTLNQPIKTPEDLKKIRDHIKDGDKYGEVIVTNFILL